MARYLVGIDLGTTNSALAYVDSNAKGKRGVKLHGFDIPQLIGAGQMGSPSLLPSFLYLPGPHDLAPESISLPWNKESHDVIGKFARNHGSKIPGRLVSSAKSWLCHPGVDRTAPLLPWGSSDDVHKISPLDASAKYIRHLVDAWNNSPNRKPEEYLEEQHVVLTVPASFDDTARNLTSDAAKHAGLKHFTLLEEPQAAFYAWLGTHSPKEAGQLKPGMRCVVVDVGGGTTDLSMIRAGEEEGELTFVRDAVGDHLLLGGDNMDLALAKSIEAKLPGGRLDAAQFGGLIQACRQAKEALLGDDPPKSFPVTVVGKGRSVVGGTISKNVTREDIEAVLFDGFFPEVAYQAEPQRQARSGLQEMGLPYVADAAITKHLAAFLRQHIPNGEAPDAILFNGGVFTPKPLQERIITVMTQWFGDDWQPLQLTSPSLDLAVAWGAAYQCWLKQSGGRRIGGGIPRSYYIGIDTAEELPAGTKSVICIVPRRLEEGEEIELDEPTLELQLGEPVLFPLYTSTVRGDDKPGEVLHVAKSQLAELPPLHTVLRGGKRAGKKRVPVTLAAKATEIGTLELYCVSAEKNRWRLEFNVREGIRATPESDDPSAKDASAVVDVLPEEQVLAAMELVHDCYAKGDPTPPQLPKAVESVLESSRNDWPTGMCRRLWEPLENALNQRTKSPPHLARWYNLVGFCLRPGFGDPLDRYRVEALWKALSGSASAKTQTIEGGADYWIMWRRVAGGLNTALQQSLFAKLKPTLLPGKSSSRPSTNEWVEMWRAAASLERLDVRTKQSLGEALLKQMNDDTVLPHLFWSLTRLGSRRLLYGPLNAILHPNVVEQWLLKLLPFQPTNDTQTMGWCFCLAQLARKTGIRSLDINDEIRTQVAQMLQSNELPHGWSERVEEVIDDEGDDSSRLFGEALPIGLRLNQ